MPKIKTNRAAAKRFKKTGTGKLKRNKAYKSHILTKKSTKRKRKDVYKRQIIFREFRGSAKKQQQKLLWSIKRLKMRMHTRRN